jgi:hypothetical protein
VSGDAVSGAMMWVGALMVFTPIVAAALVIGVVWYQKQKRSAGKRQDEQVG